MSEESVATVARRITATQGKHSVTTYADAYCPRPTLSFHDVSGAFAVPPTNDEHVVKSTLGISRAAVASEVARDILTLSPKPRWTRGFQRMVASPSLRRGRGGNGSSFQPAQKRGEGVGKD